MPKMSKRLVLYFLLLVIKNVFGDTCTGNRYNVNQQTKTSTCMIWGNYHMKTFDDHGISFKSSCKFILTSFLIHGSEFQVSVGGSDDCEKKLPTCSTFINILYNKRNYHLGLDGPNTPVFKDNGVSYTIPMEFNGINVHQSGNRIMVEFTEIGVQIQWDKKNMVDVTIENNRQYKPFGLCGNNDKCSSNDQILINRVTTRDLLTFLTDWQIERDTCPDLIQIQSPCKGIKHKIVQAEVGCKILETSSRFKEATKFIKSEIFIEACIWDYCSCRKKVTMDCLCETFDAYAKTSIKAGVKTVSWRDRQMCPAKCTGDLRFYSCAPKGGIRSCNGNAVSTYSGVCEEGCYCPARTFLFNNKCYLKKNCPCLYGKSVIQPGESVTQNCHTCTCFKGKIVCPKEPCLITAVVTGDPHYTTWDGKKFDFMGKCAYYLVKDNDFSVEADHFGWKNGQFTKDADGPSWTRGVTIRMGKDVIELKPNLVVTFNDVSVTKYPHKVGDTIITKPSDCFVLVRLPNYVQVQWDGYSTALVRLPTTLEGKVMGLLGTYSDSQDDDFLMPDGEIAKDPVTFGNSWKTEYSCQNESQAPLEHPCVTNPSAKVPAEKMCSIIKSDIFKGCEIENVDTYYENCIYDTCYCKANISKCSCDSIAAFAEGCNKKGIAVNWRNKVPECRMECPAGQVYQECNDGCSRTCEDLSLRPDCVKMCVEGCNCAAGATMDENGVCIPIEKCKCRINGTIYPPGFELLKNEDELMICKNARWVITLPDEDKLQDIPTSEMLDEKCNKLGASVYTPCRYSTPKTCENMHNYEITTIDVCKEGCECMEGYVFDGVKRICVKPEDCPCYGKGRSYSEGDAFEKSECTKCICEKGKWKCSYDCVSETCETENELLMHDKQKCVCRKGTWNCNYEQCDIWGDSHIKTFDGIPYDFQAECSYILSEGTNNDDEFTIHFTNEKCSGQGATCLKSFTIEIAVDGIQESITLTKNKELPNVQELQKIKLSDKLLFTVIDIIGAGIQIFWDKATWVYVKLEKKWLNNVSGLCGNFNQRKDDDFEVDERQISQGEVALFVDSWQMSTTCESARRSTMQCDKTRRKWSKEQCNVLLGEAFSSCRNTVSVASYYQACVMDTCKCDLGGDCECLCTAISIYAQECNNYGIPIKWRSQQLCPIQCPEDTEYQPCISSCPPKTCETIQKNDCEEEFCVEGCERKPLPKGYVYKDTTYEERVLETACTQPRCKVNDKIYFNNDIIANTPCEICYCTNGKQKCIDLPCSLGQTKNSTSNPTETPQPAEDCDKSKCKDCPISTIEVENKRACCKSCQHETSCIVKLENSDNVILKEPGEIWTNGPCKECICVGSKPYNHCIHCKSKDCSPISNRAIGNTYYAPGRAACCLVPEPVACFHKNKIYRVGELWELDDCKSLTCIRDSSTNVTMIQEIEEYCNEECPIGYKYTKLNGRCCGECIQDSCIFENAVIKDGHKWYSSDGCSFYTCRMIRGKYQITSHKTICPIIENCPGVIKKGKCCEYCSPFEVFTWKDEVPECKFYPNKLQV